MRTSASSGGAARRSSHSEAPSALRPVAASAWPPLTPFVRGDHSRLSCVRPCIHSPVQVASILGCAQMDLESVISGLLHDTVEDTSLSFEELEAIFGKETRKIVEGETKVSKLPKMVRSELDREGAQGAVRKADKSDQEAENLRSMFVAMAEDWRVVVVKLADRLHNMRTLQYMPVHKRISIARETLEIFAPLAHRLGMWSFRQELADLSFKCVPQPARVRAVSWPIRRDLAVASISPWPRSRHGLAERRAQRLTAAAA